MWHKKEKYYINILENEVAVVDESNIIFLAIKPNVYFNVILNI